jgi:hypothetical protein
VARNVEKVATARQQVAEVANCGHIGPKTHALAGL